LEKAVAFNDTDVVGRFLDIFVVSRADANDIFLETKRWIWLCAAAHCDRKKGKTVPRLIIDRPIGYIDEMWHNFILFTKRYHSFCDSHFGFYVHHNPTPKRRKDQMKHALMNESGAIESVLEVRKKQYSYIYDKLGPKTLTRWYFTLSEKYSDLEKRRRSLFDNDRKTTR
jgi:hypothetical protein